MTREGGQTRAEGGRRAYLEREARLGHGTGLDDGMSVDVCGTRDLWWLW